MPKTKPENNRAAKKLSRLLRHKMALAGCLILFLLYLAAALAEFFTPYSFDTESRRKSYQPPTAVHFDGRFYVYNYRAELIEGTKTFTPLSAKKYYLKFFSRGYGYKLLGILPANIHLFTVDQPADIFLLGSDWNGRDIFSRIIYGSRISLSVGLIGVSISLLFGLIIGGLSGYFGGKTDTIIMRLVELLMSIPAFYLMLALRGVFPLAMSSITIYVMIVLILSFLGWPGLARVIRGMVLSLRERPYIMATKALGGGTWRILFRHLLPQTFSYTIVTASLSIPGYILAESALSLLGLGIMEPHASWGNMLTRAMSISNLQFHPWILWPGIFIFITVMAFNFLGDGLRDILDPRSLTAGKPG